MNGKVKWFDAEKGYGFISQENGKDVFVHWSQIDEKGYKTLEEGMEVTFTLVEDVKGLQAHHVQKLG